MVAVWFAAAPEFEFEIEFEFSVELELELAWQVAGMDACRLGKKPEVSAWPLAADLSAFWCKKPW